MSERDKYERDVLRQIAEMPHSSLRDVLNRSTAYLTAMWYFDHRESVGR